MLLVNNRSWPIAEVDLATCSGALIAQIDDYFIAYVHPFFWDEPGAKILVNVTKKEAVRQVKKW